MTECPVCQGKMVEADEIIVLSDGYEHALLICPSCHLQER